MQWTFNFYLLNDVVSNSRYIALIDWIVVKSKTESIWKEIGVTQFKVTILGICLEGQR
jgi:hypothetical protein